MKRFILLSALSIVLLASCRTIQTSNTTQRVRSTTDSIADLQHSTFNVQRSFQKDTICILDSVRLEQRHDTVYHTRWRTEFRDRVVYRTDTLVRCDTVRIAMKSQYASVDSVRATEKNLSSAQVHRRGLAWYWKMLLWNIVAVVLVVVGYILRKQLLR